MYSLAGSYTDVFILHFASFTLQEINIDQSDISWLDEEISFHYIM
jgi:hypothetical protein